MNIFENFRNFFFDSVQYVRYDPRRTFDANRRKNGISAIFQILPTRSCCYGVKGLTSAIFGIFLAVESGRFMKKIGGEEYHATVPLRQVFGFQRNRHF